MTKLISYVFMWVLLLNILLLCIVAVHENARNPKNSRKLSTTATEIWTRTSLSNTFAIIASSCTIELCSILGHINYVSDIFII